MTTPPQYYVTQYRLSSGQRWQFLSFHCSWEAAEYHVKFSARNARRGMFRAVVLREHGLAFEALADGVQDHHFDVV